MVQILEVDHLVKYYGDLAAVKGVNFTVEEGEIFSLLGPNGAGKTTTISILSTLFAPDAGDARIGGFSVTKDPMAVRRLIGVVPQDLALYFITAFLLPFVVKLIIELLEQFFF